MTLRIRVKVPHRFCKTTCDPIPHYLSAFLLLSDNKPHLTPCFSNTLGTWGNCYSSAWNIFPQSLPIYLFGSLTSFRSLMKYIKGDLWWWSNLKSQTTILSPIFYFFLHNSYHYIICHIFLLFYHCLPYWNKDAQGICPLFSFCPLLLSQPKQLSLIHSRQSININRMDECTLLELN